MTGTRQGDFSRFSFDPKKRFSAVRVQQGRVQLDSDFNESSDILTHRLRTAAADILGSSGAPAGAPGFGLEVRELGLELGVDGHFVLIGGSEGFSPAPNREAPPGCSIELRFVPRGEGQVLGCWVRRENDGRFKPVYALRYAEERFAFQRPGLSDLVSAAIPGLAGRPAVVALHWSESETVLEVDGRPVARDANGVDLPPGPILLLLGSRQPPQLGALVCELRLWNGARSRELRARQAEGELTGGEPGLAGWWRFAEGVDELIPDRTPHGNDAVVRGSALPPRWLPAEIGVGSGRYYLGGLLCEAPEEVPFSRQPDLPSARLPGPQGRDREHHVFYLDAWERSLSALEDPAIREVALGGADTTLRDQVVTQVRSLLLPEGSTRLSARELYHDWPDLSAGLAGMGRLLPRRNVSAVRLENRLYRVEVHDAGDGHVAAVQEVATVAHEGLARTRLRLTRLDGEWRPGQPVEVFRHGSRPQDQPRRLARVHAVEVEEGALLLDLDLGSQAQVTELRVRRIATVKWSRNNAGLVFPLAPLDPGMSLVGLLPTPGGTHGLAAGVWVEWIDDRRALAQEAAPLYRVAKVDPLKLHLTLEPPPDGMGWTAAHHPLLRVWDQQGKGLTAWGTVPVMGGGHWQELEAGIQVLFTYQGWFRSGDFWWMAARTLTQDIEWPRDARGALLALPPHGVTHYRVPLALLTYHAEGYHLLDLRRTFQPYVEGAVSKAGDWMDGALDVRADVDVRGDLRVEGSSRLHDVYGRLRSPNAVGTAQIEDRAVTPAKLSEAVGLVPDGWSILGPSAQPPHGFEDSGWALTLFQTAPPWVDRRQLPGGPPGPLAGAALGGRVYVLLDSGLLWEYDPAADAWAAKPPLPLPARGAALAALDGKLYAAGGLDSLGRASRRSFALDPTAGAWIERAPLATGRSAFPLVAGEGRLHALGGLRDSATGKCATARHEAYDPLTDSWTRRRPLPERLLGCGAAAMGVWLHLVGGERRWIAGRWGRSLVSGHHLYNAQTDRWIASRAPLPTPRRNLRLVETSGRLFSVGGESELGWLRDFDAYDPTADRWSPSTPLHEAVEEPAACAAAGSVYVTGALRGGGALIEECPVSTRLFVHRRTAGGRLAFVAGEVLPALPGLGDHPLDRR